MTTLLLIHGGLWDDMDAERFWRKPGIVAGLQHHGLEILSPDRPRRAPDWATEVEHLAAALPDRAITVVAGSNGCSAAVRLALTHPERVDRVLLAWPATAGDHDVDAHARTSATAQGASQRVVDALLAGQTLRGTTDTELSTITQPVGVLPSVPENPVHQRRTVNALLRVLRHPVELPGCPEPPHPTFPTHADAFIQTVVRFTAT
jgi:pimeloyl-ACP methyl ester carboxylesterase